MQVSVLTKTPVNTRNIRIDAGRGISATCLAKEGLPVTVGFEEVYEVLHHRNIILSEFRPRIWSIRGMSPTVVQSGCVPLLSLSRYLWTMESLVFEFEQDTKRSIPSKISLLVPPAGSVTLTSSGPASFGNASALDQEEPQNLYQHPWRLWWCCILTWNQDILRSSACSTDSVHNRLHGTNPSRNTGNIVGLIHDTELGRQLVVWWAFNSCLTIIFGLFLYLAATCDHKLVYWALVGPPWAIIWPFQRA